MLTVSIKRSAHTHTQAGEEQDEKDPRIQLDRIATNLDVDKVVEDEDE